MRKHNLPSLSEFLDCLFTRGRVRVPPPEPAEIPEEELREAAAALSAFEQQYRQELPATPPPFCPPAGAWAAALFYRACQFVVFRDMGDEIIARTMAQAEQGPGALLPNGAGHRLRTPAADDCRAA